MNDISKDKFLRNNINEIMEWCAGQMRTAEFIQPPDFQFTTSEDYDIENQIKLGLKYDLEVEGIMLVGCGFSSYEPITPSHRQYTLFVDYAYPLSQDVLHYAKRKLAVVRKIKQDIENLTKEYVKNQEEAVENFIREIERSTRQ